MSVWASLVKTNNWTRKDRFLEAKAQILSLPAPTLYAAPLWWFWEEQPRATYQQLNQTRNEQKAYCVVLEEVARKYNRSVPGNWKMRPITEYHDNIAHDVESKWLVEFLQWIDKCCDADVGLYLDY